jgi:hypothetical protein
MTNNPTLKYEEIPDAVLDFAYGLDGMEQMETLAEKHDLGDGASSKLYEIVDAILQHELPLNELRQRLKTDFQIESEAVDGLRRDFTGRLLLPMEAIFEDIHGGLKEWGGTAKEYKDVPGVDLPERSAKDFVDEVLLNHDLKTGVDRLDERLMDVLRSYVVNARTREQTIETLEKPIKTGGLDLSTERAGQLLDEMDEELPFYKIVQKNTIIQQKQEEERSDAGADESSADKQAPESAVDAPESVDQQGGDTSTVESSDGSDQAAEPEQEGGGEKSKPQISEGPGAQAVAETQQVDEDNQVATDNGEEGSDLFLDGPEGDSGMEDLFAEEPSGEPEKDEDNNGSEDLFADVESDEDLFDSEEEAGGGTSEPEPAEIQDNGRRSGEGGESGQDKAEEDETSARSEGEASKSKRIAPPPIVSKVSTEITEDKDAGNEVEDEEESVKKEEQEGASDSPRNVDGEDEVQDTDENGESKTGRDTESDKEDLQPVKNELSEEAKEAASDPTDVLNKGAAVDVFDEDDEKEIAEAKERADKISNNIEPTVDLKSAVENVLKRTDATFEEEELKKRFRNIIETRMRDIRDAYETRERLESATENGGLGLSGGKLADVMQVIEDVFVEYHEALNEQAKEQVKSSMKQQSKTHKEKQEKERAEQEKRKEERYKRISEQVQKKRKDTTKESSEMEDDLVDLEHIKEAAKKEAEHEEKKKERPKMQDVRFEQKLSGPVEQLKNMRLIDFRRLSSDPKKAIGKIEDEIDLLESDGYEKRIAGIKAWRQSPVNQAYAKLSHRSLNEGKSLESIVEQQENEEKTLTWEEVRAIMELNETLRF